MYTFGSGNLIGLMNDALRTPVEFATLQDVSMDISFDSKELYGSNQFPIVVARSKGKIELKASYAQIRANAFGLLLPCSVATGQRLFARKAAPIPSATPEITVEHGTEFLADYGVDDITDPTKAIPLTKVASTPSAGSYMVDPETGKYTFAAADAGKKVSIRYMYSDATTGKTITMVNEVMGTAPKFQALLSTSLDGVQVNVELFACVSKKLGMSFKQEDFMIPDFDFSAFATADGVGYISLGQ
jgi:hypothetical protein